MSETRIKMEEHGVEYDITRDEFFAYSRWKQTYDGPLPRGHLTFDMWRDATNQQTIDAIQPVDISSIAAEARIPSPAEVAAYVGPLGETADAFAAAEANDQEMDTMYTPTGSLLQRIQEAQPYSSTFEDALWIIDGWGQSGRVLYGPMNLHDAQILCRVGETILPLSPLSVR